MPADARSPRDPIREARQQWIRHGWSDAADGMAMVTSLTRVQQLLNEQIDAVLRPEGLTFARYEILRLLSFVTPHQMPMTRLGSLLQVHATSVTSAVSRLVTQGYVERLPDPQDGRVVLASLTEAGAAAVERATDGLNQQVFATPGITPEEVRALTRLLGRVRAERGDTVHPEFAADSDTGSDTGLP